MQKLDAFYVMVILGSCLHAQELQTNELDQALSRNYNESAIVPSGAASGPTMNTPQNRERMNRYQKTIYTKIVPLAQEAEKNGFTATSDEITAQRNALTVVFPYMPLFEKQLRDEIIARKYSQTLNGTRMSDADIQNAYKQMLSEYPDSKAPAMADVLPLLQTQVVLENRAVQDKIQELNDQRDIQTNQNLLKAKETWPLQDMRSNGPGDACVAEHKDSSTCLLTIKQYNDFVPFYAVPKSFPLDSARAMTIRSILTDLYIASEARAKGFAESDSAAEEKRNWKQDYVRQLKSNKLGKMVVDPVWLRQSYSMFYDALFRTCYYPHYSIIGSSDSLYIDSIFKLCRRIVLSDSQRPGEKNKVSTQSIDAYNLHWSHSHGEFLPGEFGPVVDTLHISVVSPLIKTSYGFFVVRLDSVQVRYEVSFEDAGEKLIILATKQKYLKMDSLLDARADSLYSSNKRLNHFPDTLLVRAVLTPEFGRDSFSEGKTSINNYKCDIIADPLKSGVEISTAHLPYDVRDSLLSRFEAVQDKKNTIGPIHSRFGIWNFTVIGRKRQGGKCPFSFVRKRLIDSLVVYENDCGVNLSWDDPDSSFDKTALAKSYAYRFYGGMEFDLEEEKNPGQNAREILDKKVDERNSEIDAWLSKFTIHYKAIFASNRK
jgi:hypothetical protein